MGNTRGGYQYEQLFIFIHLEFCFPIKHESKLTVIYCKSVNVKTLGERGFVPSDRHVSQRALDTIVVRVDGLVISRSLSYRELLTLSLMVVAIGLI